jgi:hypothetical protein
VPDTWQIVGHNGKYLVSLDFTTDPDGITCGTCGEPMNLKIVPKVATAAK